MPAPAPWWQSAVLYQIYPRSFLDSGGDGIGDLEGVRARLPYLRWLGVDGIWLSPVYRSPMADFGYDVSDHCDVDAVFGDLATFDRLLGEAHEQGLRVLLDWVPNHTSDRHPWFLDSRSSRDSPKRDWYFWRDGRDGGPPNNWAAAFGGPAWTWDDPTRQWYLHLFLPEQPDLNWGNPAVVDAMHGVLRFWLDRGVDGFRADVVHLIGKDPALPDQPPELADIDLVGVHDHPSAHPLLRGIRAVLDSYPGDRAMVGEVNLGTPALLARYYGDGDELHMVFNFSLLWAPWDAARWKERIVASEAALAPVGGWPVWVLSNHDTPRHRTRYGGSEDRARTAATVLLTLRGTPFLYAGEELGLDDAAVPEHARVDPGGRDGCRAPIPWDPAPGHGWAGEPWLPWPPDPVTRNTATLTGDDGSILHLYRRLLACRRRSPALQSGAWRLLGAPEDVLAFERRAGDDVRQVWANFGDGEIVVDGGGTVEVGTRPRRDTWDGRLAGGEAVVVRPQG
ncbi:MAG TPA: alpha-amylase family glycosyl hydrolase [Acidimicrobiales bacterium]|nr:alpha-amylase family glycosyl hydrolase [Acidimicrobiales bacterium]